MGCDGCTVDAANHTATCTACGKVVKLNHANNLYNFTSQHVPRCPRRSALPPRRGAAAADDEDEAQRKLPPMMKPAQKRRFDDSFVDVVIEGAGLR